MYRSIVWLSLITAGALAAATPEDCHGMRKHGRRAEARACYESLTLSRDPAVRAEGYWGIGDKKLALKEFDAAIAAAPKNAMNHVRVGMLFHEGFNDAEAEKEFEAALELDEHNARGFYGLALIGADGFDTKAVEFAVKAIEADPKLVEAHELMANLALENSDPKKAAEKADEALKLSNDALDAMAVHAAIEALADRSPDAWLEKVHKVNPTYGDAESLVAHHLVLNRRYDEGIAFYRKAIALDPELWSARSELGINLMRMGKDQEARTQLDLCFDNGYKNLTTTNSLRLLDSYKNFTFFETPTTVLKLNKKEADVLRPYFESEMKRALATYDAKYKMKLPGPVQVEVYPDHEDFAVRTMGMPGLGALGVTFGQVVAMDSPSGRKPGTFHWASTMWHELSHVYVLTATNHRVPRWFTEGLAVHEETAAAPDWGDRVTPDMLMAMRDKKLLPIAELDRGFIRPSYPNQIIISYFQAGRICDYINERWGWNKLLDMIHAFATQRETSEVIQEQLGMSPEDFDKQFLAWLDKQLGPTVAAFDDWRKKMKEMVDLHHAGKDDDIIKMGDQVIGMYSDFVETGSAYELVSDAYLKKNDKPNAMRILSEYSKVGGRDSGMLKKLATLQEEAGQKKAAAATLDRINLIYPVNDEELHRRLGELWLNDGNIAGAIREFGVVVASHPTDKATSYYNLARAYQANHQPDKAEEQIMNSLEAAPTFRPAQKMLLELQDPKKAN